MNSPSRAAAAIACRCHPQRAARPMAWMRRPGARVHRKPRATRSWLRSACPQVAARARARRPVRWRQAITPASSTPSGSSVGENFTASRAAACTAYQLSVGRTSAYAARAASLFAELLVRARRPVTPTRLVTQRVRHRFNEFRRRLPSRQPKAPRAYCHSCVRSSKSSGSTCSKNGSAPGTRLQASPERDGQRKGTGTARIELADLDQPRQVSGRILGVGARIPLPAIEQRRFRRGAPG